MKREQEIRRRITLYWLVGICLLGFAIFAPDSGNHPGLSFIQVARHASWHQRLDWKTAWCSVKLIVLSLGGFLLIEAFGTWLIRLRYELPGMLVYLLHVVPLLGMLAGGYYLLKSLA